MRRIYVDKYLFPKQELAIVSIRHKYAEVNTSCNLSIGSRLVAVAPIL